MNNIRLYSKDSVLARKELSKNHFNELELDDAKELYEWNRLNKIYAITLFLMGFILFLCSAVSLINRFIPLFIMLAVIGVLPFIIGIRRFIVSYDLIKYPIMIRVAKIVSCKSDNKNFNKVVLEKEDKEWLISKEWATVGKTISIFIVGDYIFISNEE